MVDRHIKKGKKNTWDPQSDAVQEDQIAAYDAIRKKCPIAHSDYLHWSIFSHKEVKRILEDHQTFSNQFSRYISIPNGLDLPQHREYRKLIEPYFNKAAVEKFKPLCQTITTELCHLLQGEVEVTETFATEFSIQIQAAFMGWPDSLHQPLLEWITKQHQATLQNDRKTLEKMALEFDGHIRSQLAWRRNLGENAPNDVTTSLLKEEVADRLLTDEELVSIIRNWTVGELGTITACVTIITHYLAIHPEIQRRLREEPSIRRRAIDEILRIHAPLISNRRITTKEVEVGGVTLPVNTRLTLMWASANRDEEVFGDPDEFRLDRNPEDNLLYGAGLHICPGERLARLELEVLLDAMLAMTTHWHLVEGKQPERDHYPASGFSELWVNFS